MPAASPPRPNAPELRREASTATPCQWGLQPRTAQGCFLETFTPTLSQSRPKFQGFSRSPALHQLLAGGSGGASSQDAVKSRHPPGPRAGVSGDPKPRVSQGWGGVRGGGGGSPGEQAQPHSRGPHAKKAALCHPSFAPAAASVVRATLEVIFDPKGAPYRSARPQTMAPGHCEPHSPSSTFDSRGVPHAPRFPREGMPWGQGPTPDSTPTPPRAELTPVRRKGREEGGASN